MNRALVAPLIKLSICCAVLIVLLILSPSQISGEFQGLVIATTVIVVGPVTLLVAIDFGRVLKRQSVSPTFKWLSLIPQRLLGGIACVAGIAGVVMSLFAADQSILFRMISGIISLGIVASGILWIRDTRSASPKDSRD
jgi:hypothetical protein